MAYKIVMDSCGEQTEEMKRSGKLEMASLSIEIDNTHIIDDDNFNQAEFLRMAAASPNCPKSSCPSPERYMDSYKGAQENVYVVTLSSELSGSYNSAELGKKLYYEEVGEKNIYIFNSRGASIGETLIAKKIMECEAEGMTFEAVITEVERYIEEQKIYFILENLDTLRKNGRLTGIKAFVASALNIKPIMGATKQGIICQLSQARGTNKALVKMVDMIVSELKDGANKTLAISHCNCKERAEMVKTMIQERVAVKDVFILDTRGISSMYANDGGIIVAI